MEQIPKKLLSTVVAMLLCLSLCGTNALAGEGPDEVIIDSLAQLYEPVNFDHAMHEEFVEGNCSFCHHHTLGTEITDENCMRCHADSEGTAQIACQGCHSQKRFDAEYLNKLSENETLYHRDPLGLKGAYHARCMNCHEEMGAPNGCQDCHARTDVGNKFYHAGSYSPPKSDKPAHGEH